MDKLKLHTPDHTAANVERIAALFPNCLTEVKDEKGNLKRAIDFDLLKQELSGDLVEGPQERYRLDWPGKREALALANTPVALTLRPCREESVDFENTKNLFIEGDNLDALKLLQETYLGKVKMIYIDPPYNTGNDFIYEDDFTAEKETYELAAGERDQEGNRMMDEERWLQNTTSNGRFHSDWLSMIYPRIKLARNLLKDDGAIFISIDDHEIDNLRKICDEVFGAENFIATVIWQKVFSPKNTASYFSEDHDFIVIYARDKNSWKPQLLPRSKEAMARYTNVDSDPRGVWLSGAIQARNYYSKGSYEVESPSGKKYSNPKGTYWRFSKDRFLELDRDKRIWWGEKGDGVPRLKRFLSEVKNGVVPQTLWKFDLVGHTQEAKEELLTYVPFQNTENILNSVKPSRLIQHAVKIGTAPGSGDIVLDFFAGSGPTAQAVIQQNSEDDGGRRFILVQIPEPLPKPEKGFQTIADLAIARIMTTAEKAKSKNESELSFKARGGDVGFRKLRTDSSNMKQVHHAPDELKQGQLGLHTDNIKDDRTPEDLLFQVLVDCGVDLALPIAAEEVAGKKVFFVDGNALAACFDPLINEDLVRELAKRKPLRAVFRDNSFGDDSMKINLEQVFKLLSPGTELKTL